MKLNAPILRLKRRNLIYIFLIYCCIALTFTYMFGANKILVYTVDVFNIIMACFCIYDSRMIISKSENRGLKVILLFLAISILIGFLLNGQSWILLLWGARNNYRGIVFMLICIYLSPFMLKSKTYDFIGKIFVAHVLLVLYQFFILEYKGDFVGGIFGTTQGGNSGNNLMLCLMFAIALWKYLHKKKNVLYLAVVMAICFSIAAFEELKFFFVEIFIIAGLLILLDGGYSRKIKSVVAFICGIVVGLYLLYSIFPQWVGFFNLEHMMELMESGRGLNGTTIDRFSGFPELYRLFYNGKGLKILFGYGLGSADYSLSFDFLLSPIYKSYVATGYSSLSYGFLFIELGIVGFALYLMVYVRANVTAIRSRRSDSYNSLSIVMGCLCLLLLFYDVTMKIEPQYFAYLILSMPYWKCENREEEDCLTGDAYENIMEE